MTNKVELYELLFPLKVNGEDTELTLLEYYHNDNEAIVMGNAIAVLINCSSYAIEFPITNKRINYQTIWNRKQEDQVVLEDE